MLFHTRQIALQFVFCFSNDRGLDASRVSQPSLPEDTYRQVQPWLHLTTAFTYPCVRNIYEKYSALNNNCFRRDCQIIGNYLTFMLEMIFCGFS